MSDTLEIVHCGGCERRSLLEDVEAAGRRDDTSIDEPHCPRCGTRLENDRTTVRTYTVDSNRAERDALYRQAREQWALEDQINKAAEEFAEVAAALNRLLNDHTDRDEVLEELVDAQLMLEQLQLEFRGAEYQTALDEATADLEDRLDSFAPGMVTMSNGATTVGYGPDPEHFEQGDTDAE